MVSLNKQTDFNFPFAKKENLQNNSLQSFSHKFDSIDFSLSFIALSFFFAIILMISLDGKNQMTLQSNIKPKKITTQSLTLISPVNKVETKTIVSINKKEKTVVKKTKSKEKVITRKTSPQKIIQPKSISKPALAIQKKEYKTSTTYLKSNPKTEVQLPIIQKTYLNQSTKNVSMVSNPNTKEIDQNSISIETDEIAEKKVLTKVTQPKPLLKAANLEINEQIPVDALPVSYFAAKTKAEIEGKLLIIKFGAKWCLPCRQMNNTTFKNKEVKNYLENNYVSLNVDVQDFDGINMQSYFNVKMLPTMLFFNSTGKFIGKYAEFISTKKMLEILEKHKNEETSNDVPELMAMNEIIIQKEKLKVAKIPTIVFNQINLQKTKTGKPITSLRSKAKNWRITNVDFSTKYITDGDLLVKIKEKQSGDILSQLHVPWTNSNLGITDSTSNFQLDIPLKKRKKKNADYVLEIFHVSQNSTALVGKKQLIEDGQILD